MARSSRQKMKLLYIMDHLLRCTDETHPTTTAQLTAMLRSNDIEAERKSIYDDIDTLRGYGLDILSCGGGRTGGWYVGSRDFQLPELKLLVDSIQSSKFITESKTLELIGKLEIHVANRVKTMNESIYYNVDAIHHCIAANEQLRFHYFEYTVEKKRRLRRGGAWYVLSPYALTWDDENYYMVAYDAAAGEMRHRRAPSGAGDLPQAGHGRLRPQDLRHVHRRGDLRAAAL